MKLILINGKKRSGKDYTASLIKQEIESRGGTCEIMSFAQPMKFIISKVFGITEDELDLYKNDRYRIYSHDADGEIKHLTDFRQVLQQFGTEAMKPVFGDSVWADILYGKALKSTADVVLVPDFRFMVEYMDYPFVKTLKIQHLGIEAACTDPHPSETELDSFKFDYIIDNSMYGDLSDDVKEFVSAVL